MLKKEGVMINIKNITKVLLMAMFICAYSGEALCFERSDIREYSVSETPIPSPSSTPSSNTQQDATFCGADKGVFSELVMTGQKIFNRLRDLIYVVAGFGIIAVAVGGFFGNLNWKWLGAIVISLVVIASAGELIVLLTGCEQYGTSLITNTLEAPTQTAKAVPAD